MQNNEIVPLSHTTHKKISSKWIKDLNIQPDSINLPEESIGKKLIFISVGNDFFGHDTKAQTTKVKINKWDLHQTKKLLHSKRNHQQNEKSTH